MSALEWRLFPQGEVGREEGRDGGRGLSQFSSVTLVRGEWHGDWRGDRVREWEWTKAGLWCCQGPSSRVPPVWGEGQPGEVSGEPRVKRAAASLSSESTSS